MPWYCRMNDAALRPITAVLWLAGGIAQDARAFTASPIVFDMCWMLLLGCLGYFGRAGCNGCCGWDGCCCHWGSIGRNGCTRCLDKGVSTNITRKYREHLFLSAVSTTIDPNYAIMNHSFVSAISRFASLGSKGGGHWEGLLYESLVDQLARNFTAMGILSWEPVSVEPAPDYESIEWLPPRPKHSTTQCRIICWESGGSGIVLKQ